MEVNQYCQSTARTCRGGAPAKGLRGKERQNIGVVGQQAFFGSWNQGVLLPGTERSEPEIPLKAGLIGGVDAGSLIERLRLEAEGIGDPFLAVAGALKLNLVTAPGHHREQAILVGDTKRLEHGHRLHGQRQTAEDHGEEFNGGYVGDQGEQHSADCEPEILRAFGAVAESSPL